MSDASGASKSGGDDADDRDELTRIDPIDDGFVELHAEVDVSDLDEEGRRHVEEMARFYEEQLRAIAHFQGTE